MGVKARASNTKDAGIVSYGAQRIPTGFRNTELGLLPTEWAVRSLGELGQSLIGLTYDPQDIDPSGVLVLRSSNIGNNLLQFGGDVYVKTDIPDRIVARRDDLLICVRNGSRPLIGKCALIDERAVGMTFGAFMSVFRSDDNRFVFHCFQSDIIKRQINEHLGATINQITNKSLNSFKIPYPGRREREAITAALLDIDELLGALEALIAKKQDIKLGAMQRVLTGETRLPGFRDPWETKRIGETLSFLATASHPRAATSENGQTVYIHYGDVHSQRRPLLDLDRARLPRIDPRLVKNIPDVQDGDLVMVDASEDLEGVGKSVEVHGVGNQSVVAGLHTILCRSNPDHWAFGYKSYLQFTPAFKSALVRTATGTSVYGITKNQLANVEIPLPPPAEQQAISTILNDIDTEIVALERRRDKTRAVKQGMMQELLTGRTRLM